MASLFRLPRLGDPITAATSILIPLPGDRFEVTGTETIATLETNDRGPGARFYLSFADAATLTHGANLALPHATDYTTSPGDVLHFEVTAENSVRQLLLANSGAGAGTAGGFATAEPESPVAGSAWLDTLTDPPRLKVFDGEAWFYVETAAVPTVSPDDDAYSDALVAYYKRNNPGFGGTWFDTVNGATATLQSGTSWLEDGVDFSGGGGGATATDAYMPTGADPRTFLVRVKIDDFDTANHTFGYGPTSHHHRIYLYLQSTLFTVQIWDDDLNRSIAPPAGVVHTVALTYDGEDLQLWFNGSALGAPHTVDLDTQHTGTLYFGRQDDGGFPLDGTLYALAVWNRALDASEIAALSASTAW